MKNKIPMRTCCGCRQSFPRKELVRIVRKPDGETVLDVTGRTNGRGAYLCRSLACLAKARKSGSIARSLEAPVSEEVFAGLEKELAEYEA